MTPQLTACTDRNCLSCTCHLHAVDMAGPEYDDAPPTNPGMSVLTVAAFGIFLAALGVMLYLALR